MSLHLDTRPHTCTPDTPAAALPAYSEETVAISTAPLELAVRLARTCDTPWLCLYERKGEWSIGLHASWVLRVDGAGVVRSCDGKQWQRAHPCQAIAEALRQLPVAGWRAYGRAQFEFSYLKYGITPAPAQESLLTLTIPRSEIRLRDGEATLRCLDARELPALQALLRRLDTDPDASVGTVPVRHLQTNHRGEAAKARYQQQVAASVAEIRAGEYQKVIMSRSIELPRQLDLPHSYLRGRIANTPVRSFLLRDGDFESYGFSPETVVEVDAAGLVSTQPLAGTRALHGDPERDARLRSELLHDTKEVAEHAVSVKLAVEEMQPMCSPESIGVSDFMSVSPRGSVQHLASRVQGRLAEGKNAWDAFENLFPAVTASGIPKRAAIDSIRRHEPNARGLYSGCMMIADSDGSLDAALVLRTAYRQGDECWMRVGAGIVDMSTPEREWEETCEKADCIVQHLYAAP